MVQQRNFPLLYWLMASFFLAFIYRSFVASLAQAWMLATMLLPGAIVARILGTQLWNLYKTRIHYWVYLLIAVLWFEYMGAIGAYWFLFELDPKAFPIVLINPAFSILWIGAFVIFERYLDQWLWPEIELQVPTVTFLSNRREIRLPQTECLFIESRDKFTLVHTIQGSSYQTHQSISQWSDSLTGWIRTHRGYLVNPDHIRSHSSKDLELACGSIVHTVPISRTYKENVEEFLRR